jgi:hypothetical protein
METLSIARVSGSFVSRRVPVSLMATTPFTSMRPVTERPPQASAERMLPSPAVGRQVVQHPAQRYLLMSLTKNEPAARWIDSASRPQ